MEVMYWINVFSVLFVIICVCIIIISKIILKINELWGWIRGKIEK